MKNKIKSLLGAGVACVIGGAALTGCTTAINHGNIVSVSSRGVGFRVVPANSANESPEVDFGFFSQNVQFVPTATNAPINTPKFANTFTDTQNGALNIGINETIATGDIQANNNTNIASIAIVPK